MGQVTLRPELKNAGGESLEVMYKGRNVGTMTLLYREGDRLVGSVQLEKAVLAPNAYDSVMREVHDYVQATIDALAVPFCQVVVTYGRYDHVIATEKHVGQVRGVYTEGPEAGVGGYERERGAQVGREERTHGRGAAPEARVRGPASEARTGREAVQTHDARLRDVIEPRDARDGRQGRTTPPPRNNRPSARDLVLEEDTTEILRPLELVIVGEGRGRVEYHVYDAEQQLVAEVFMRLNQGEVIGDATWYIPPTDEEIDEVTELLVSDFDSDEVDTFNIAMRFDGEEVAHIELAHEDFFDREEREVAEIDVEDEEYSIRVIRDDQDSITYEIYAEDGDRERVGTATVDISGKQVSGYVDFIHPGSREDREVIASMLMREVDKEREYDTFNVAMLYQDELIDEIAFDQREVH